MLINLTKSLFVLLTILAIFITSSGTAFAETVAINASKEIVGKDTIVVAQASKEIVGKDTIVVAQAIKAESLTPQQRQQIQAIRQGRNRNIGEVLNSSQKAELVHNLRSGDNLDQAVKKLELQLEQRDMINAIQTLADLKIKAVISRE